MSRAAQIARTVRAAGKLDREWLHRVPEDPATRHLYTPWIPAPADVFLTMLFEALPDAVDHAGDDPKFLDVGCGPGSKLLLARDVAGLAARGIERVPEYAAAARSLGLDAETAEAADWKGYSSYDLILLNRPFRDPARQEVLERKIWHDMSPGAIVMCLNLEAPPPPNWIVLLEDPDVRRWIRQKPLAPGMTR